MSKANIIRTAFNTLAEAHLIESNKARRAELRALRAKHNLPGSNPTSAKIGHLAGKAVAAYKSPWTPAGSKGAHKGITDLAKKYGAKAKKDPQEFSQSSDALDQDADTTYRGVEREEKGEPTSYTTGIKKGILTGRKIIKRAMEENTMNYRQSLRALFEAVIEETTDRLEETKRANKQKMAGILRKKADWEESGDEFRKAKHLRAMASGRDPGPKGGTGKDSPEAKAKKDARSAGRKTQYGTSVRTPQEIADEAKKARQRPDPSDKDAGVKNQARDSRLRKAESAKAKREGKPDPHAPRGGRRLRGGAMGTWVYKPGIGGARGKRVEWDEPDDE